MLTIKLPAEELFDESKQEFLCLKEITLELEHSLVSLSKWESKWHKPFISKKEMSMEETIDYIKCMTLTPNVDQDVYERIGRNGKVLKEINNYIDDSQSAAVFNENKTTRNNGEFVTSETIYYWMISSNIPFECQYWHLNRLIALIKFCSIKNDPKKKKMSNRDILSQNDRINAARRKALGTKG